MNESDFDISVILCCYNSSTRLSPTLEHLSKQKLSSDIKWEVILVDNNSNDNTEKLAKSLWSDFGSVVNLKVVTEINPGLSNARKKGIESSKGEILIFCDDDNWFDENYLQLAFEIMNEDATIGMLGGIGEEVIEEEKPSWFEQVKLVYAVGPQNENDGDITLTKGYVYGAGSIIKKVVLLEIYSKGFVSQLTDRVGKTLVSGGDNEIGYMIAMSGFKIHYSSQLKFKHYLPKGRLTIDYLCRMVKGQQLTCYKIKCYESGLQNKPFKFPENRFYGISKSLKKIIKLFLSYIHNEISYIDYKLTFTRLLYKEIYLLMYFNTFREEIINIEKNIVLLKKKLNESISIHNYSNIQ